jgi:hypothetical protein
MQEVLRSRAADLCLRAKVLFSTSEVLRRRSNDHLSKTKGLLLESEALRLELQEIFVGPERIS